MTAARYSTPAHSGRREASLAGRVLPLVALLGTFAGAAWAQPASPPPSVTQCFTWDGAYVALFEQAFWVSAVATLVLALVAGLFGRWFWIAAAPRLRVMVAAALVFVVVELAIVALPWLVGFGWLWLSGVDARYFDCLQVRFSPAGFFGGLFGRGIAAVTQWPLMTLLLLAATTWAALIAWQLGELIARLSGLRRMAQGAGA